MAITVSRTNWTNRVSKTSRIQNFLTSRLIMYTIKVTYGAADNYVTNGNAISLKAVGLKNYVMVLPFNASAVAGTVCVYDTVNEKIKLYGSNGAAPAKLVELANTDTGTQSMTIEFLVIGQ